MTKLRTAVTCSMLLVGCGGGPSKVDVTGTWEATVAYTSCTTQNFDSRGCGSPEGRRILLLTQTGSDVSGHVPAAVALNGRIKGQDLTLEVAALTLLVAPRHSNGDFECPEIASAGLNPNRSSAQPVSPTATPLARGPPTVWLPALV
jgi:hypothetical protein